MRHSLIGPVSEIKMARYGITVLVFLLASVLAGCSGYRVATIPSSPDIEEHAESDMPVLKVGMRARVFLTSGAVHNGEVTQVSGSQVTLGRAGNYGFEETSYPISEIDKVEVESSSKVGSVLTGSVGVAMFGFMALVLVYGLAFALGT